MKLLEHVKVSYDTSQKAYLFNFENVKVRKITSRMFPILINKNKYQSVGFGVLDRVGFIEFEDIDPFYTVRGAIGEYLVGEFIKKEYKETLGIEIELKSFPSRVSYDNGKTWYGNDMFKSNEKFGGVVDFGLSKPFEHRATIEVKSKDLKKYNDISKQDGEEIEEVLQGKMLATLSSCDKLLMAYAFFDEEKSNVIKANMSKIKDINNFNVQGFCSAFDITIDNVKILIKKHMVDKEQVMSQMETAHENLMRIVKLNSISTIHFNDKEKEYLNNRIKETHKEKPSTITMEEWNSLGLIF